MKKSSVLRTVFLLGAAFILTGCHFFTSLDPVPEVKLTFDKSSTLIKTGQVDIINLSVSDNQNNAKIVWMYDETAVMATTDNYSAIITGLKPGVSTIKAICGSSSVSCSITVTKDVYQAVTTTNPYVYASEDVVSITPGVTRKISASLFGGTNADINGYIWSIDKPSVASISTEGNYCWITGVSDGTAKITVRHNKASYPYSVLVNCSADGTAGTYLTTASNIVNLNLDTSPTAEFGVSLVNPSSTDSTSSITWSAVDVNGSVLSDPPVTVSSFESVFSVTAKREGECYIRITHPSCTYPLDVFVRIYADATLSYIEPSQTFLTVSENESECITVTVRGASTYDPSLFTWTFSPNASYYSDYTLFNGNGSSTGDSISFKGKKPGSIKATVSYPGLDSREIVIIVRDISSSAADAQSYISIDRNYYRVSSSDSPFQISAVLHNSTGNASDFVWHVSEIPAAGVSGHVITIAPDKGITATARARSALLSNSVSNFAIVTPCNPGTAYIDISHPGAMYPTRVTVNVYENNIEINYCDIIYDTQPVIKLLNGESFEASVILSSNTSHDVSLMNWTASGLASVSPSGCNCIITAPSEGSGNTTTVITVTHPDCQYSKTITVYCADDFNNFEPDSENKYIYTNLPFISVPLSSESFKLSLSAIGFTYSDYSLITWTINSGEELISWETIDNIHFLFTPLKPGIVKITASHPYCMDDVSFTIIINPDSSDSDEHSGYLTASDSVLWFASANQTKSFSVELRDSYYTNYSDVHYDFSNDWYEYSIDDNYVTVTSLADNVEGTITITHPLSQNSLTVYLKTGSRYEYQNEDVAFITVSTELLELSPDGAEKTVTAALMHSSSSEIGYRGFSFSISDFSVAEIAYVNNSNTCTVIPKANGTAVLTVSNPDSSYTKDVIVIVGSKAVSTIPYLTTENNILTVLQGDTSMVTVSLKNGNVASSALWHWDIEDPSVVNVITADGGTAMLRGMNPGTTRITVTHDTCEYPLELIVTVVDSASVSEKPYISGTSILTVQKGSTATFTVDLVGNDYRDNNAYFRFSCNNSSVIMLDSSSNTARIRGLNTGSAVITVSNTLYPDCYSKSVLVIVEDSAEDNIYIRTSDSVIKLAPDDGFYKVTAELANGNPADYDDFIFWTDDASLVSLSSISNQCSVIPTGRSGTTKIHVKHRKAAKQADIIVLVSRYEDFAFSSRTASVTAGKFSFYPLHVPAMDEDFTVRYSSSNEDICLVQGSSSVAWLCGINPGTVTVTAEMVDSSGNVIASDEMLAAVSYSDLSLPEIALGSPVVSVVTGETKTFSATLMGSDVQGDVFNLSWAFRDDPSGVSVVNGGNGRASGSQCTATFLEEGEYVLTCTHPSGASSEVIISCTKKGELSLTLDTYLYQICLDDGLFELTATVNNGSVADEDSITWAALKSGGKNIVSISKSSGSKCIVIPKAVGQTTVIAKLPDGHSASCTVIVKASAEVTLGAGTIHVIPGYTETVRYRTVPEDAVVNWYAQMTGASLTSNETYFTVENDAVNKELKITGLKDLPGAVCGTVTGILAGASSANLPVLNVYCEYNVEVRCETTSGQFLTNLVNDRPDTDHPVSFNIIYYPTDLDIDLIFGNELLKCFSGTSGHNEARIDEVTVGNVVRSTVVENGFEKGKLAVSLVPHAECRKSMSVTATLPSATSCSCTTGFTYTAFYDSSNIEIAVDLLGNNNKLSKVNKDSNGRITSIDIANGEQVSLSFRVLNENASGFISPLNNTSFYNLSDTTFKRSDISVSEYSSVNDNQYIIKYSGSDWKNTPDSVTGNGSSCLKYPYYLVIKEPMYNGKYLIPHNASKEGISNYRLVNFSTKTSYTDWYLNPADWHISSSYLGKRSRDSAYYSYDSHSYSWSNPGGNYEIKHYYSEAYLYNYSYTLHKDGSHVFYIDGKQFNSYDLLKSSVNYVSCKPYIISAAEIKKNPSLWDTTGTVYSSSETYSGYYDETTILYEDSKHTFYYSNPFFFERYSDLKAAGVSDAEGGKYCSPDGGNDSWYYSYEYEQNIAWQNNSQKEHYSQKTPYKVLSYFDRFPDDAITYKYSSNNLNKQLRIKWENYTYIYVTDTSGVDHEICSRSDTLISQNTVSINIPYLLIDNTAIVPYNPPDYTVKTVQAKLRIVYNPASNAGTEHTTYEIPVNFITYSDTNNSTYPYSRDMWEKIQVTGADGKTYDRWILKE